MLMLVLALCLFAHPASAKTHVDSNGTVDRQKTFKYSFTVTGDGKQKLKATIASDATGNGSRLRVRFFTKSPSGGQRELHHLKVQINGDYKETSDTFKLEPGTYKVEVYARRTSFTFRLEDDFD